MKNILFLLIAVLFTAASIAQTYHENVDSNSTAKLEYIGFNATTKAVTMKVTNKSYSSKLTNMEVRQHIGNGSTVNTTTYSDEVLVGQSKTISFTKVNGSPINIEFKYKVGGSSKYLHVALPCALPVRFVHFAISQTNTEVILEFTTVETSNLKHFEVNVSLDGKNYQPVMVIMPDNVQPNKPYTVRIPKSLIKSTIH